MSSIFARSLMTLIASISLAACVAPTRIESNAASGITILPKRLFVFSNVGKDFGDGFYEPFVNRFTAQLLACGVQSEITTVGDLDLDNSGHLEKMKAFIPDYTMVVRRNGGTRMDGRIIHVIYDVRMTDASSFKNVWRASVNFYRGGTVIPIKSRGEALADDLVDKMVADGLLKDCALLPRQETINKPRPIQPGQ